LKITVPVRILLNIQLRPPPPWQIAKHLAFNQHAADELGGDQLGGVGEEG